MSFVVLRKLRKAFGGTVIFDAIDLKIERGQMCVLVGPSGCGKTTLLRAVAGLTRPDAGTVLIDGADMTASPPQKRGIGMVFQHYALFPNLTVEQNLAFGLEHQKRSRDEIKRRVDEMIHLVGLAERAHAYPHKLSGGQKQRVALARALITEPKLILFDEPMSALDAQIRKRLREELKRLQRELGFTGLFVTHDQEEALVIGDQVAVMRKGHFEQVGAPIDIYNAPATRGVAEFIGDFNVLEPDQVQHLFGRTVGGAVAIHPEAFSLAGDGSELDWRAMGSIRSVRLMGPIVRYEVAVGERLFKADSLNRLDSPPLVEGSSVILRVPQSSVRALLP